MDVGHGSGDLLRGGGTWMLMGEYVSRIRLARAISDFMCSIQPVIAMVEMGVYR